jgi:acetyl-CoA C-acetyltransferase
MRQAVICEPLRTPVGGFGGVFRELPAARLAAAVIRELVSRTAIPPDQVDDVLLGQCYPNGEEPAIGRVAALDAGLPVEVPGLQLDRRCGSGLTAVMIAAMEVQTGVADLAIAGGAESMSRAEHYTMGMRWGRTQGPGRVRNAPLTRVFAAAGGPMRNARMTGAKTGRFAA